MEKRKKVKIDLKKLNELYHEVKFDMRNIIGKMQHIKDMMENIFENMNGG